MLYVGLTVMACMAAYESLKQLLWPRISVWESHLITIVFSSICGSLASFWVSARLDRAYRKLMQHHEETERLRSELERSLADLQQASQEVESLASLLPVCAWCRKIEDETGHWHSLESFVSRNQRSKVTHGMCPQCAAKFEGRGGTYS